MNAIAKIEKPQLLQSMADKYQLEPADFARTVRATCGMPTATPEQFAAFLIVAKTYNLNPILREIWAFPSRAGGIVPIVSIDGWANIVNSHPLCDGFEFEMVNEDGAVGCTCRIYRKDRKHPVSITEWFAECQRATDVWKTMPKRMLRHKAFIQAARLAFGLAGIYDEDEGRVIAEAPARDVTPLRVPSPTEVEVVETVETDHGTDKYRPGDVVDMAAEKSDPISSGPIDVDKSASPVGEKKSTSKLKWPDLKTGYEKWITMAFKRINEHMDGGELETFWNQEIEPQIKSLMPPDQDDVIAAYDRRQKALKEEGDE
jgi:phage recombination protein Bet